MVKSESAKIGEDERYHVILVRDDLESVVFSGDLATCEDWLALNGVGIRDGYFEIRPVSI